MAKPIVKVVAFAIEDQVHIYVRREDSTEQEEKHYTRPQSSPSMARLAGCLHTGTIRGNTHVVPFLSGVLGWTARQMFE